MSNGYKCKVLLAALRASFLTSLILVFSLLSLGCAAAWFIAGAGVAATAIAVIDDEPQESTDK